jgi:agmatine/peptidylarginine deiminase
MLTTERCLLAPTRNPGLNKAQIEEKLMQWFGLKRVMWLRRGDLLGDDTDGHIDTIARFCDPGTIAYQACDDRQDAHYEDLAAMAAELEALRDPWDKPYKLVPLPLPTPIYDDTGRRLPAGYPNFLILNGAVLVPTYGCATDEPALERLRPCFPSREVIGIDCRALIHQYGSLHCVTMQIPSAPGVSSRGA